MKTIEGAVKEPLDDLETSFYNSASLPLLIARLVSIVLVAAALVTGNPTLEWTSLVSLAWMLIVVWGHHILFVDNLRSLPNISANPLPVLPNPLPGVSLIVPVRNEERGISASARALGAINYPALEVIIVDDHSTDATPRLLHQVAQEFPTLRILTAPDVPDSWAGKTHACWFAFEHSDPRAEWLIFTDGRVIFEPGSVLRAVVHAEANKIDFLSCVIRFDGKGVVEELIGIIQNAFLVCTARTFGGGPPPVPFGLGAFMLVRRDIYLQCGGHSRFPSHPLEDFVLARSAARAGAVTSVAIASGLLSLRRYLGFRDMRRRMVRTLRIAANDSLVDLLNRISLELFFYVLPLPVALAAIVRMFYAGATSSALFLIAIFGFASYAAGTCTPRACRALCGSSSRCIAWFRPLGGAVVSYLVLLSMVEKLCGRPISWRGRTIFAPKKLGAG